MYLTKKIDAYFEIKHIHECLYRNFDVQEINTESICDTHSKTNVVKYVNITQMYLQITETLFPYNCFLTFIINIIGFVLPYVSQMHLPNIFKYLHIREHFQQIGRMTTQRRYVTPQLKYSYLLTGMSIFQVPQAVEMLT